MSHKRPLPGRVFPKLAGMGKRPKGQKNLSGSPTRKGRRGRER